MISVIYALVCLASFIIAKQLEDNTNSPQVSKEIFDPENDIKNEKKDKTSQSLTTLYPEPAKPL